MAWVLHLVREKDSTELLRGAREAEHGRTAVPQAQGLRSPLPTPAPEVTGEARVALEKPGHVPIPQSWKRQNRVSLEPRPRVERGWPSSPASLSGLPGLEP